MRMIPRNRDTMNSCRPEGRHGFPSFGHCYCPAQSSPVHGLSTKVIWCASIALGPYSSSYLCAPRPSISLILDLIAVPPSPTSPSRTQASSAAPVLSIAELIMRRHMHIAFFRFPFVNSRFLIAFFPDDALNPPSSPPPPHPRRHVLVAGIAVSTTGHHSSSSFKHHPSP